MKHIPSQQRVSECQIKWSSYLQQFTVILRHKVGKENLVADALSRRKHLLTTMVVTVTGFEQIKQEYTNDKDFGTIYADFLNGDKAKHPHYSVHDGFLFQGNKLYLPATSIREHVVHELHSGGCSGHL